MKVGTPKKMKDGSIAYLSGTKRYFIRREPDVDKWKYIEYFDLKGNYIPMPFGWCGECGEIIQSLHCGDFVMCSCGASGCDVDRMLPERHRHLGSFESICGMPSPKQMSENEL